MALRPLIPTLSLRDPATIALLAISLFAGIWRISGLEREGLNMDEVTQAKISRGNRSSEFKTSHGASYQPPASLISPMSWVWLVGRAAYQEQPPLDYILQRFVNQFSARDAAQRAVACTSGTIAVFLTGWLGMLLGGARVGLVSALLLSLSPLQVELSRTGRPYTIAQVGWLTILLVAYWAYRVDTRRAWIILSGTAFIFLLARGDLPLFALAALGATFLAIRCWKGVWALAIAGALYLPVLGGLMYAGRSYITGRESFSFNVTMLTRGISALSAPAPYILLSFAVLGCWAAAKRSPLAVWFIGLCGLTFLLHMAFWFARVGSPLFPRYLVHYSAPLAIMAAFGFCWIVSLLSPLKYAGGIAAAIFFLWLGTLAFQRQQLPTKEDWREAAVIASDRAIDHIWMFKTGQFVFASPGGPARVTWVPEFSGDWYRPIAYSTPLSGTRQAPQGRLAICVWEEDLYDAASEPLLDSDSFEHIRLHRVHLYLPRGTCGPRCTMDGVLKILARQSGYTDFRDEVKRLDWYQNAGVE
jgi:hypothetical protein